MDAFPSYLTRWQSDDFFPFLNFSTDLLQFTIILDIFFSFHKKKKWFLLGEPGGRIFFYFPRESCATVEDALSTAVGA